MKKVLIVLSVLTFCASSLYADDYKFKRGYPSAATAEKVDEVDMPAMHRSTYSLAETFDVGRDTGTQVSRIYEEPFPFTGKLDRVTIMLTE